MSGYAEQTARWMYRGIWSGLVRWFRVPSQPPTLPAQSGELIHKFQPDEGFLRYLKFWFWFFLLIVDISLAIGWFAILYYEWWLGLLLAPVAWIIIIVPDIIVYIAIHLRYDTTWYVMTDRSLRIRRGIWVIHELTITFENVQNIKVKQGPIQRFFGISTVEVKTAGGGDEQHESTVSHRGIIEGIAKAQEIRDRILTLLREAQSAGLGDDLDSIPTPQNQWTPEHVAALRSIRNEFSLLYGR